MQRLEKDLQTIDAEIIMCERLLKLADPDGYFKEGTRAAADAKAKGAAVLAAERSRREAAVAKQRQQQVHLHMCVHISTHLIHRHTNCSYTELMSGGSIQ